MAAEAKVRLSATGAAQVRNALRGVRREATAGAKEQARGAQDGARVVKRTEQEIRAEKLQSFRQGKRFNQRQLDEARRNARMQLNIQRTLMRDRVKEAERAVRREIQLRKQLEARSETGGGAGAGRGFGRRIAAPVVGAVAGGIAGTIASVSQGASIAGIKDQGQRIQDAANFDLRFRRLAAQSGDTAQEREALQARTVATSTANGLDQGDLLSGLELAQERFPKAVDALRANLESLAKTSVALNVPFSGLIGAAGTAADRLQLTTKETDDFLKMMAAAGAEGVIEAPDFSEAFAPVMGAFAATTGRTGMSGAREFLGLAQAIGTNQSGASENATQLQSMLKAIADGPSRDNIIGLLRTGGRNTSKSGLSKEQVASNRALAKRMTAGESVGLLEIVQALAQDKRFDGVKIMQTLGRQEAAQGFIAAVGEERKLARGEENTAASRIAQTDAGAGAELIDRAFGNVAESAGFTFAQKAAEAQANITQNLDGYAKEVTRMADAHIAFEKAVGKYGLYTQAFVGAVGGLGLAAGGQALVSKLGTGAAVAGGGAAAAGGAGALGLAGTAALWAGGAVAAGGGAYYATSKAFEAAGADKMLEGFGAKIFELFNGVGPDGESRSGGGRSRGASRESDRNQEQMVRVLQSIERNTKARAQVDATPPPPQSPVRGREGR